MRMCAMWPQRGPTDTGPDAVRQDRPGEVQRMADRAWGLSLVKLAGGDQFRFSVRVETDALHRSADRAFRKTLAAGRPLTAAARSSSSRRSASSAQSPSALGSVSASRLEMSRSAKRARWRAGSCKTFDSSCRTVLAIDRIPITGFSGLHRLQWSARLPNYVLTWRMHLSGAPSPHWLLNPSSADRRLLPLFALRRSVSGQRSCTRPHGSAQ